MLRLRYLLPLAAFAMVLMSGAPSRGETIIDEWSNVKAPPAPELKSVTLDPKTTALLVMDIIKQTCNMQRRPRCVAMIPKVQKLLAEARAKGVYVIYALYPSLSGDLPQSENQRFRSGACGERRRTHRDGVRRQVHAWR